MQNSTPRQLHQMQPWYLQRRQMSRGQDASVDMHWLSMPQLPRHQDMPIMQCITVICPSHHSNHLPTTKTSRDRSGAKIQHTRSLQRERRQTPQGTTNARPSASITKRHRNAQNHTRPATQRPSMLRRQREATTSAASTIWPSRRARPRLSPIEKSGAARQAQHQENSNPNRNPTTKRFHNIVRSTIPPIRNTTNARSKAESPTVQGTNRTPNHHHQTKNTRTHSPTATTRKRTPGTHHSKHKRNQQRPGKSTTNHHPSATTATTTTTNGHTSAMPTRSTSALQQYRRKTNSIGNKRYLRSSGIRRTCGHAISVFHIKNRTTTPWLSTAPPPPISNPLLP